MFAWQEASYITALGLGFITFQSPSSTRHAAIAVASFDIAPTDNTV